MVDDLVAAEEEGGCDDGDDRFLLAGDDVGAVQSVVEGIVVFTVLSSVFRHNLNSLYLWLS